MLSENASCDILVRPDLPADACRRITHAFGPANSDIINPRLCTVCMFRDRSTNKEFWLVFRKNARFFHHPKTCSARTSERRRSISSILMTVRSLLFGGHPRPLPVLKYFQCYNMPPRVTKGAVPWESLHDDVWREIARRLETSQNRRALQVSSRAMRQAVTPVVADITLTTRAALCHALKIAYGFRRVLMQFTDAQLAGAFIHSEDIAHSVETAGRAHGKKVGVTEEDVYPELKPFRGTWSLDWKYGDSPTHFSLDHLFMAHVNGMEVIVGANVQRNAIHVRTEITGHLAYYGSPFCVSIRAKGATIRAEAGNELITKIWTLKQDIGLINWRLKTTANRRIKELSLPAAGPPQSYAEWSATSGKNIASRHTKVAELEKALRNMKNPEKINDPQQRRIELYNPELIVKSMRIAKSVAHAIKACVKSIHRTTW